MTECRATRRTELIRRALTNLSLALAGLAAGLLLLEAVLRLSGPAWRPGWAERATFWRHDPELGWHHRPGQRGTFAGRGFRVEVRINSRGLRDREHADPPQGAWRVLLLGDSYGWGYGVERDSGLCGRLDRPSEGREVVNGSVSGYGTVQELLWYRREGFRYRPDLVLLLVSDNDVFDNCMPSPYWYRKPRGELEGDSLVVRGVPVPAPTFKERLRVWVLGRTYVGAALRGLWWRVRGSVVDAAERAGMDLVPGRPQDPADSSCFQVTRAVVAALRREAGAHGAATAVALGSLPRPLARWWTAQAAALELPLLDLQPRLSGEALVQLRGDPHWNARGHALAAAALAPFLDSLRAARGR